MEGRRVSYEGAYSLGKRFDVVSNYLKKGKESLTKTEISAAGIFLERQERKLNFPSKRQRPDVSNVRRDNYKR